MLLPQEPTLGRCNVGSLLLLLLGESSAVLTPFFHADSLQAQMCVSHRLDFSCLGGS